ncbi:MAG: 6,7-dimethyl-8-ribityllumazine synthase [Bacteroidota bacterium]
MSSSHQNLSSYSSAYLPNVVCKRFEIVKDEWNSEITFALLAGALETLKSHGVSEQDIYTHYVPGSFELVAGGAMAFKKHQPDVVICLGCVIQGETRHFDFICNAVANGLAQLSATHAAPFIFGVLTTDNMEQAKDRSGGKHGNKGVEAAVTAIKITKLIDD